ncbi:hypothetical protein KUV80_10320 [Fictibacillus nanhaiensis]|uniref:hypothetical protein n=1 Tax=Fictibacillus nanhaiensis TaxID=742169 RepID=UPI001C9707EF|nr:hypothetical protein [Fictibacillus nanhaiensis]MBY6037053.1 hypothetical protein [Fictibacillus nanhaiensis]
MNRILSEKGNTLIVVLLMIVILTVAGLSLVTTTFNGVKKTDARETQIQSVELAEKGIDYLAVLLETKTQALAGLSAKDFEDALTNILQKYEVNSANAAFLPHSALPADDGVLKVKVYDRKKLTSDPEDLSQTMIIHSEAVVNGKKKILTSTIRLGAKQVPDALKYALGAYNPCKGTNNCNTKDDDGNMFLHGGVAIKGDLYVERNLITKNKGIVGADKNWVTSDLPSVEGENGKKAHLILPGNLYKLNSDRKYSDHIKETNFSSYQSINKQNVSSAFTAYTAANKEYVPIVDSRSPQFSPIHIEGQRSHYYFPDHGNSFPVTEVHDSNFNNIPHKENIKNRYENENVYVNSNNDIKFNGSFTFNRLSSKTYSEDRDIMIRSGKDEWSQLTFKQGAYFGGDVIIGNPSTNHYNFNNYDKFEIDGPIFVDGDLTIWGANIKFNSTIYVTGQTTIRFSRLQGIMDPNHIEKSLVLFGKESILIANNNVFGDDPNIIRGFFYSEDLMEIYGVGSNVEIQGGVFGRKVVLNATRGKVRYAIGDGDERGNGTYIFELNQTQISPDKSRLKIIYNPELIKNPPEGLPTVKDLSVTQVDRKIQ